MSNARHQVRSDALDARKTWVLSARCRLHAAARYSAAARESSSGREIAFWRHTGVRSDSGTIRVPCQWGSRITSLFSQCRTL
jgi:hypothetical protein